MRLYGTCPYCCNRDGGKVAVTVDVVGHHRCVQCDRIVKECGCQRQPWSFEDDGRKWNVAVNMA